jgi:hypothetical protein
MNENKKTPVNKKAKKLCGRFEPRIKPKIKP